MDIKRLAIPPDFVPRDGSRLHCTFEARQPDGGVIRSHPYVAEAAACPFGGVRWFWLCPGCGQRRLRLYAARGGYFYCRECLRLTYWTRQKSRAYDHNIRSMLKSGAARQGWTPYLMKRLMFDHVGRRRGRRWRYTTAEAGLRSGLFDPSWCVKSAAEIVGLWKEADGRP